MKRTLLLLSRGLKSVGGDTSRVSLETINKFLNSNGLSYKDGHSSFLVKCTRCDIGDGAQRPTVFVNKTTGSALCNRCSLSGNKQLSFLLHRKSSLPSVSWNEFTEWFARQKTDKTVPQQLPKELKEHQQTKYGEHASNHGSGKTLG